MNTIQCKIIKMGVVLLLVWVTSACKNEVSLSIPEPKVNPLTLSRLAVGDSVEITGENIHLITAITFDGVAVENISSNLGQRSQSSLKIAVPSFSKDSLVQKVEAKYNSRHYMLLFSQVQVILIPKAIDWTRQVSVNEVIKMNGFNLLRAKEVRFNNNPVILDSRSDLTLTVVATAEMIGTQRITFVYDNILGENQTIEIGEFTVVQ